MRTSSPTPHPLSTSLPRLKPRLVPSAAASSSSTASLARLPPPRREDESVPRLLSAGTPAPDLADPNRADLDDVLSIEAESLLYSSSPSRSSSAVETVAFERDGGVGENARWEREVCRGGSSGLGLLEVVVVEALSFSCGCEEDGAAASSGSVMLMVAWEDAGRAPLLESSASTSTSSASRYHFRRLVQRPQPSCPRRPFCHC